MMNVCDLDMRTDKRKEVYASWQKKKKGLDVDTLVWFAIYKEILFAFVIDLSTLTFILLIKKIHSHQFALWA
jgi:hypothetical protein